MRNQHQNSNVLMLCRKIIVSGVTVFPDGERSMLPDWIINLDFESAIPLASVRKIGDKMQSVYESIFKPSMEGFKIECSWTVYQEGFPVNEITPDDFFNGPLFSEQTKKDPEIDPEPTLSQNGRRTGFKRPNYGIGRDVKEWWNSRPYAKEYSIQFAFDHFKKTYPKLNMETFKKYITSKSMSGGHRIVIDLTRNTIRKAHTTVR